MGRRFSSEELKWIAMGTMAADHLAVACLYQTGLAELPGWNGIYIAMRLIGRMAFPLFAFLLIEGFLYTRSRKRYALRLAILAVVSELPYNLVAGNRLFFPADQNAVFELFAGLLVLWGVEAAGERLFEAGAILAGMAAAHIFKLDYGAGGILLILVLYRFRHMPQKRMIFGCAAILLMYWDLIFGASEYAIAAWFAFWFIDRYSGEQGRNPGRMPYLFYPAHLLLLYFLGRAITAF